MHSLSRPARFLNPRPRAASLSLQSFKYALLPPAADSNECSALALLAITLMHGGSGLYFSAAAVQELVACGQAAAARCKPWMPTTVYGAVKSDLANAHSLLETAVAASPPTAAGMVCILPREVTALLDRSVPTCAMCGGPSHFKKCSKASRRPALAVSACTNGGQRGAWHHVGECDWEVRKAPSVTAGHPLASKPPTSCSAVPWPTAPASARWGRWGKPQ